MKYLMFICADGMPPAEELTVIQRELPGWAQEVASRGVRQFGRELDDPRAAVTVRVRDGETLVTDGPFAETKEFIAGFNVTDCADLDEMIEIAARCPISWFQTLEIRPFLEQPEVDEKAAAFGRGEDATGDPYALLVWVSTEGDATAMSDAAAWRADVRSSGLHVFGSPLGGADTATTVRVREGQTLLGDGPYSGSEQYVAALEVVGCRDRQQAVEVAAAHPLARRHAIEVRPFWKE